MKRQPPLQRERAMQRRGQRIRQRAARQGNALLIAVIVLGLCSAILVTSVRTTLARYTALDRYARELQAEVIAESALRLEPASNQANADPADAPHTRDVTVPATTRESAGTARVTLTTLTNDSQTRQVVSVVYPADAPQTTRVQVKRQRFPSKSPGGTASTNTTDATTNPDAVNTP